MLTNLEQLDNGVVWRIPGGIHPPEQKHLSNQSSIGTLPLDEFYYIPVPQVGEQAAMAVAVGDHVLKGQVLTRGLNQHHLPVHAPTSGVIKAIEPRPSNHASGLPVQTCVIQADGQDTWVELRSASLDSLSNDQIVARVQAAGVAGMGGAAFPSHIKLSPASDIELVVINAVECEPYITSDDRLMREHADKIVSGMEIIHKVLGPQRMIVGIEDNKPEAAEALRTALKNSALPAGVARVTVVPTKYPSGGEKQLIQLLTGKEVPSGAIPAQLGILVHNVGTCAAISDAVLLGKPLIERVVTVTGTNVAQPGNYWMPVGTRVDHVLKCCGFNPDPDQKVIIGGPMMGYTLPVIQVPILKGTNCVLVPSSREMAVDAQERSCIRCSECAQACPASLLPQQLYWHSKSGDYDKAADYNLRDCIECGCCSYVCPSDIPLVEYFRVAKSAIRNAAEEKVKSEKAKQRFEAKQARLEEEKRQREEKAKEAAARRQNTMSGGDKDAIAAALARVQAKKTASTTDAPPSSAAPADRKSQVADAVARAKARKAAQAAGDSDNYDAVNAGSSGAESQKDKVAAAIARAKAKKAAMQSGTDAAETSASAETPVTPGGDSQKDKVAAAIARAKAKKAALKAQQAGQSEATLESTTDVNAADVNPVKGAEPTAEDAKKARVAAAVAKAKAKKAAEQAGAAEPVEPTDTNAETQAAPAAELSAEDAKKARVAAAIAKAKAKKAAEQAGAAESAEPADANTETQAAPAADLSAEDAKKARIAAAVAKAKAKKAAEQAGAAGSTEPADANAETQVTPAAELSAEDAKKARIAAAVAKEKAKKAAEQASVVEADEPTDTNAETQAAPAAELSAEDAKKARIAAAVAKAKAKKAARNAEDKE